ncbi:MAG: hypothetical protein QG650_140 [Patescibacteria group bacterium]|nr:hypothetical protein [Patescibacteria group bacterium]
MGAEKDFFQSSNPSEPRRQKSSPPFVPQMTRSESKRNMGEECTKSGTGTFHSGSPLRFVRMIDPAIFQKCSSPMKNAPSRGSYAGVEPIQSATEVRNRIFPSVFPNAYNAPSYAPKTMESGVSTTDERMFFSAGVAGMANFQNSSPVVTSTERTSPCSPAKNAFPSETAGEDFGTTRVLWKNFDSKSVFLFGKRTVGTSSFFRPTTRPRSDGSKR